MTEWRAVVGWEGLYEVSDYGDVRSLPRTVTRRDATMQRFAGGPILPTLTSGGYYVVRLSDASNGRRIQERVHRLVACAFIDNSEGRPEVNHIDGVKTNNWASNLEWVSAQGNRTHAWRTGLRTREHLPIQRGSDNGSAVLTEDVVRSARAAHAAGASCRGLARQHGVDASTMRALLRGETWKHLLPDPPSASGEDQ